MYDDVQWHLNELELNLLATRTWLEGIMPAAPSVEEVRAKLEAWMDEQSREQNLSEDVLRAYVLANPIGMSADGLVRYWKKFRSA